MGEEKHKYAQLLKEEQEKSLQNDNRVIFEDVCPFVLFIQLVSQIHDA